MRKLSLVLIVLVFGALVAGALFLATWDIPPPSATVEKVLPDERFPR
jgi:Flp pilus assembly protein CpaB